MCDGPMKGVKPVNVDSLFAARRPTSMAPQSDILLNRPEFEALARQERGSAASLY